MNSKYAKVKFNVLSVKRGEKPLPMRGKVFPIVSEDMGSGVVTLLAGGRQIPVESRYVDILSPEDPEKQKEALM